MPSAIDTITFDCHDPALVAEFWCAALGYEVSDVDEGWGTEIRGPGGSGAPLLFLIVPESKTVKNRVHLDIRPPGSMEREAERLISAGATMHGRDAEWIVMQDPEGNEFCVLSGPDDGWVPGE